MPARDVVTALAEVLAPRSCFACGRRGHDVWCPACDAHVEGHRWRGSAPIVAGVTTVAVRYVYRGPVAEVVLAGKLGGRHVVWRDLGRRLAVPDGGQVLQPVPTEPRRRRRRGFDHTAGLAAGLAEVTGLPVVAAVVASSGAPDRGRVNAAGHGRGPSDLTWHVTRGLDGLHAVVVDDLTTTGQTIAGVARACRRAGASSVSATVLAATPR